LWKIDAVTSQWLLDVLEAWKFIPWWTVDDDGVRRILPRCVLD
jgi:hypothetical protein